VAVDRLWIPTGFWPSGGGYPLDATAAVACAAFAGDGNLTALQWARTQGCAWDSSTCERALGGAAVGAGAGVRVDQRQVHAGRRYGRAPEGA